MGEADLIVRGATVIDGTGRPGFRGDIAVSGGKILAVGDCGGLRGREEIDAAGLACASCTRALPPKFPATAGTAPFPHRKGIKAPGALRPTRIFCGRFPKTAAAWR